MKNKSEIKYYVTQLRLRGHSVHGNGGGWIALSRLIGSNVMTRGQARGDLRREFPAFIQNVAKVKIQTFQRVPKPRRKWDATKYDSFYTSREWRALRYQALRKHGGACQCCGASAKDGARIHVDHIKARSMYPELELVLDNLQVLCEECNLGKSNLFDDDWRPADLHRENVAKLRLIK